MAGESVEAFVVHQETTFDHDEVRRHITVLVLTPGRLVLGHADDHPADTASPTSFVTAATEAVPLSSVRSVVVNRVIADPMRYRGGAPPQEVTVTIGWGAVSRTDSSRPSAPTLIARPTTATPAPRRPTTSRCASASGRGCRRGLSDALARAALPRAPSGEVGDRSASRRRQCLRLADRSAFRIGARWPTYCLSVLAGMGRVPGSFTLAFRRRRGSSYS